MYTDLQIMVVYPPLPLSDVLFLMENLTIAIALYGCGMEYPLVHGVDCSSPA